MNQPPSSGSDPRASAPRLAGPPTNGSSADAICSARGCRAPAEWALRWNNPRLHTPDRRKTWLACPTHRESLGAFLGARGFLRDVAQMDRSPRLDG